MDFVRVKRLHDDGDRTLGMMWFNGKYECLTLEDEKRTIKVSGETRIPAGTYKVKFRKAGRIYESYKQRFPWFTNGIPHLQDVPNFTYIYIHIGTNDDDTAGCLLVGDGLNTNRDKLLGSTNAMERFYRKIAHLEEFIIKIEDE